MAYRNGAGALISLTFDDGLPCQIEHALPALNERHLPATFFVIANHETEYDRYFRGDIWRAAIKRGHEIGSHSVKHRKAASLSVLPDAKFETQASRDFLHQQLDERVSSFCYPFTDAPQFLQTAVQIAGYTQARGGRVAHPDKYMEPGDGKNLFNVPCFHVGPETVSQADEWIATAVRRGAWLTLMFHGVGSPKDWDNLTVEQFTGLLDKLVAARCLGLSTVTFADGAELYREGRKHFQYGA